MAISNRTKRLGCLLVVAACAAALLLASGPGHSQAASTETEGIDPALAARFAVLSGSNIARDALADRHADGMESAAGANRALARRLDDGRGRTGLWLIPGRHSLCLVVQLSSSATDSGETCRVINDMQTDLLMTLSGGPSGAPGMRPNEVVVAGVVPDGVDEVQLTMTDGSRRTLNVVNNCYTADVDGATQAISYVTAAGKAVSQPAPSYTHD